MELRNSGITEHVYFADLTLGRSLKNRKAVPFLKLCLYIDNTLPPYLLIMDECKLNGSTKQI